MSKKADLQNLIRKVFCLLAGMQILLGLVWLAGKVVGAPFSVLAVLVAWMAYSYFLKQVFAFFDKEAEKRTVAFWAAYAVTFPMIMHVHVNSLFYSLSTSCVLIFVAEVNRLIKKDGKKKLRIALLLLTGILAISGMWAGGYVAQKKDGEQYRPANVSSVLLSRFVWPYFMRNSFFWEEEVRETFSDAELIQISTYPELVKYQFEPGLEEAVGTERAKAMYRQMAWDSFRIGKKDAIKDFGRDLLANTMGPWMVRYQLSGRGVSYMGRNYADMCEGMPGFAGYYVEFSLYSFEFMALFTIVVWLKGLCQQKRRLHWCKVAWSVLLPCIIILGCTMTGNGMQDYLKVTSVFALWCSLPAFGYGLFSGKGKDC